MRRLRAAISVLLLPSLALAAGAPIITVVKSSPPVITVAPPVNNTIIQELSVSATVKGVGPEQASVMVPGLVGPPGPPGIERRHWRGIWEAGVIYQLNDVITKEGISYICPDPTCSAF